MISIVEHTFKFLSKSARRTPNLLRLSANFSTQKSQEETYYAQSQKPQQTKPESTQEIKPINKPQLIEKFKTFSKKIDTLKSQIQNVKDFEETVGKYNKLTKELSDGRNKITDLIDGGKKQWDVSKEKITDIEDKNYVSFGKELIKFNEKLKELSKFNMKEEENVLAEGIGMTSRILNNTLLKFNFKHYEPLKEKYDSKKHTKVGQGEPKKDAVISKIVEPGWIYKTTVIEQAKVEV